MKRWLLVAIGLLVYAIALLSTAPATLVDAGLRQASDGRLRLAEAKGTLWSGSGQIELRDARDRTGIGKHLAWRIQPGSLLRGYLMCEVALDQSVKRFPVTISLSRVEIVNADISLPATALGLGMPKLAPLRLTGEVELRVVRLSIERGQVHGNATLQLRDAGSVLTPISPLGDYELRVDGDGKMIHAYLRTIQGPLKLEGKGSWASGANPAFLANARVAAEHQEQLAPLLRLIAVERSPGSFELVLK